MIGKALKLLRVWFGKKSGDLAKSMGVHSSVLSMVENGRRQPSLDLLKRYSKEFGIPASKIMFFAEELERTNSVAIINKMLSEITTNG